MCAGASHGLVDSWLLEDVDEPLAASVDPTTKFKMLAQQPLRYRIRSSGVRSLWKEYLYGHPILQVPAIVNPMRGLSTRYFVSTWRTAAFIEETPVVSDDLPAWQSINGCVFDRSKGPLVK